MPSIDGGFHGAWEGATSGWTSECGLRLRLWLARWSQARDGLQPPSGST